MYLFVDIPNLQPLSTPILIFICDVRLCCTADHADAWSFRNQTSQAEKAEGKNTRF
jgi:hypothetical protein